LSLRCVNLPVIPDDGQRCWPRIYGVGPGIVQHAERVVRRHGIGVSGRIEKPCGVEQDGKQSRHVGAAALSREKHLGFAPSSLAIVTMIARRYSERRVQVHDDVCANGYDAELGSFVQS